ASGSETAPPTPDEALRQSENEPLKGLGFPVAKTGRQRVTVDSAGEVDVVDPCSERVVWIVTALHTVWNERWAERIEVALVDTPETWTPVDMDFLPKDAQLSEAQKGADIVLLPVALPSDFVWTSFRYGDVPSLEPITVAHFSDDNAHIDFVKGTL